MHLRRLAFAIMLICPLVFAVEAVNLTFAVPVAAVIIAIVLGLVGMLANALSNPQLEAWFRSEVREFAVACVLACIITVAFISSGGVSIALTGDANYVAKSTAVLDKWLGWYDNAYFYIIKAATKLRTAATYAPYMNIPLWVVSLSYSSNPLAGASMFFTPLTVATSALTNAIFLAEGARLLILFCGVVVPDILLPLSFILRMVPFTRKLGNTMIAVSIAAAVFLPFSVIFADELNKSIAVPAPRIEDLNKLDANPWVMTLSEGLCQSAPLRIMMGLTDPLFALVVCGIGCLLAGPFWGVCFAACFPIVQNVVYPILTTVLQVVMTLLIGSWEASVDTAGYGTSVFQQLYPFLRDVNNLGLLAYMDFIIVAVITIGGARSLSAALGGEWYMAGIQRLI